ncbi:MAG: hypothetical protein LBD58_09030 [Treponema sp.]|nr:hypothetical protein [Treponema sp.]
MWDMGFDDKPAWLYAPLAMTLKQPAYRTPAFAADRVPERRSWHTFGIEADILWAISLAK